MKQKVETVIIVMGLTVTICAHLAAVPAAIAYTLILSSATALAVYVASLLVLLLPIFFLVVAILKWTMVELGELDGTRPVKPPPPEPGEWTRVNAKGRRQPEVERTVNRRRGR